VKRTYNISDIVSSRIDELSKSLMLNKSEVIEYAINSLSGSSTDNKKVVKELIRNNINELREFIIKKDKDLFNNIIPLLK
jgi:hypothetical protein